MKFYRLVKPVWAQPTLANGEANPKFVKNFPGNNVVEGVDFTPEFLQEKNSLGYNVYFFPNRPSRDVYSEGVKHLNGRSIDVFEYVFVDMDLKDGVYETKQHFLDKLAEFTLKPTFVVDSGNGVHAYWRVTDLNRADYVLLQFALLQHFQTDESVWTVLQLMRLPGYFNTKNPEKYVEAAILESASSGQSYSVADFPAELVGSLSAETLAKAKRHCDRLDGISDVKLAEDVNIDELPDAFFDLMLENSEVVRIFRDPKSFGDRSAADFKLANLLFTKKFSIKDAILVLANTQKALEKGPSRIDYAKLTVAKVYQDRPKYHFETVSEYLRSNRDKVLEPQIYGPKYLDFGVLGDPWRRKEILGLVAGSGIGKTAVALNLIKEIIENNPGNDDVYVFFSLEMSKGQIIKRWLKLVGEDSALADRLYVVDTQDANNMPITIGLQEIYGFCLALQHSTGKHLGAVLIDHFHLISTHIDVRKKPNFGIGSEQNTGYGNMQNLSPNMMATQLKSMVKTLDTFFIVLAQTTKEKGVGDLPIGKDGAYGISQFEWIMDYIITIWQPLMRVQQSVKHNFLAYQYAKIREKHPGDKIKELEPKLLTYSMEKGTLRPTTPDEYSHFAEMLPQAQAIREALVKKKPTMYTLQIDPDRIDKALANLTKSL